MKIACVRWDASGNMLGSSDIHDTAIVTDFKTGKMIYTGKTPNGGNLLLNESYFH